MNIPTTISITALEENIADGSYRREKVDALKEGLFAEIDALEEAAAERKALIERIHDFTLAGKILDDEPALDFERESFEYSDYTGKIGIVTVSRVEYNDENDSFTVTGVFKGTEVSRLFHHSSVSEVEHSWCHVFRSREVGQINETGSFYDNTALV